MQTIYENEIVNWKKRRETNAVRLKKFQKVVFDILEDHGRMTESRLIRFVSPRSDVKSLKSIVDKIRRNRKKQPNGERPYDFEDIEDFVGIKILCPYHSSAEEVMKWIINQSVHFTVKPTSIEEAWEANKYGYRGWHFIAEPNISTNPTLIGIKCEIQVKTMLQEAWDAQTHDISYKKEELIDKDLLYHIKYQSDILAALDKQSEIIRRLIQQVEEGEREHKIAAATIYLSTAKKLVAHFRDDYGIDLRFRIEEDCPLSLDKLAKVNEAIGRCSKERKLNSPLIQFAAIIALCQRDAEQEEIAFSLATDFVNDNPNDPDAEDTIAGVYWALDRFDDAIRHGEEAINKASVSGIDPTMYQNSFCYWVAEAVRARMNIEEELLKKVLDLSEIFIQNYPDNFQYLDTVAFVKIALGTKIRDIESGLKLTRKAWDLATQNGDEKNQELMRVFCKRHERLAFFKINQILSTI